LSALRWIRADNPGPFTLDGTRTYVVGRRHVAVLDPGPDLDEHVRGVFALVRDAERIVLVLTHGHPDHAGSVDRLVAMLARRDPGRVEVVGAGHHRARSPDPVRGVFTDAGPLLAVPTPGHTPDHLTYHWPDSRALFAGDHLMGSGDTTWVAGYPGCVADYFASLRRLRGLDLAVIHPAHGPSLDDPAGALDRFERHRRARIQAVRDVLAADPGAGEDALYEAVYGDSVPAGLERAAREALRAVREYVDTEGGPGISSPV
jgi:glyoxylase-like metal-dependent hydrolase (beta-lactamase superfamily II)